MLTDVYRLLLRERTMLHSGKHGLVPTFEICCCHQIQDELKIFIMIVKCHTFNIWHVFFSILVIPEIITYCLWLFLDCTNILGCFCLPAHSFHTVPYKQCEMSIARATTGFHWPPATHQTLCALTVCAKATLPQKSHNNHGHQPYWPQYSGMDTCPVYGKQSW